MLVPMFLLTVSGCARLCALALLTAWLAWGPRAGQADSRIAAENLAGKTVDPFAESRGRPLVLLFVRTDCPVSNRYAPLLEKLSEKFSTVRFWLVYPDGSESSGRIRSHLHDYGYSIPALRDPRHALVERASATVTPEAAVFDRSGKLVYHGRIDNWYEDFGRSRSAATTHELEDAIAAAIKGSAPASGHAGAVGCYIADLK
jgi:thiol-disulfide isomerase/thioredoxin